MSKSKAIMIYNLFPLLAGKFTAWGPHIQRAADMGFDWIFVNPVQQSGKSGSLYSTRDYFSFDPRFIDEKSRKPPEDQLRGVLKETKKLGLRTMVDLVINHCAADSPLLQEHPEWFEWERKGRVAHPFAHEDGKKVVWKDLAKFNHGHSRDLEGLYAFYRSIVRYLVKLGFDGFRCDAAYQLPQNLWERLIKDTLREFPDILFVAETLGCTPEQTRKTAQAGFHFIFNSSKWWDFHSPWLMSQYNLSRDIAPSIAFPESHDTIRLAEEMGGNIDGLKQRYLFAALFSAGVMAPIGFEYGFRKKPHVVQTTPADWEEKRADLTDFITAVNAVKKRYAVFQEDAVTSIHNYENPHVLLMWKASPAANQEALVILNKDIHNKQHFRVDSLASFVQKGCPLTDVSPEYAMDYLPSPFSYDLRPGQGIVLVTNHS